MVVLYKDVTHTNMKRVTVNLKVSNFIEDDQYWSSGEFALQLQKTFFKFRVPIKENSFLGEVSQGSGNTGESFNESPIIAD